MKRHIKVEKIEAQALPGSTIVNALKEAISIAIKEERKVELTHNCIRYFIDPDDIIDGIPQEIIEGM